MPYKNTQFLNTGWGIEFVSKTALFETNLTLWPGPTNEFFKINRKFVDLFLEPIQAINN